MDAGERAAVEAARRRLARAQGQTRDAVRELARLLDTEQAGTVLAVTVATDDQTARHAHDLIDEHVAQRGGVQVVLLARPRG